MAEPFFRIEPDGFRFSYPDGDILISNTSLDRLGRSQVDIIAPGGGFLAEDLVNLKTDSDRWKLSQQAALRDGVEAVEWADRLLVSYKHLEQAAPQFFGPKSIVNSYLYSGDGDGLWFSMGAGQHRRLKHISSRDVFRRSIPRLSTVTGGTSNLSLPFITVSA